MSLSTQTHSPTVDAPPRAADVRAQSTTARFVDTYKSILRIVVGLLFFVHGAGTIFGGLGVAKPIPTGLWPYWWAALIQLVAGGLVLVGLLTRPAALLCAGSMAYAYFTVHLQIGLWPIANGGELAAVYAWVFLTVAVLGGGAWSLDALFTRARRAAVS
jgi:putative oxidoreductase